MSKNLVKKLYIGENIREYRSAEGLTQKQLGRMLGASAQSVCKWERGVCYPDITLLPAIAEQIGCTVDELLNKNMADPL